MNSKIYKIIYKMRLRKPFKMIDRLHYLKRLKLNVNPHDKWFYVKADADQYSNSEVLMCSEFENKIIFFKCDPKSYIEKQIIRKGLFEEGILRLMKSLYQPGTSIVDIGANIGAYSLPLAKVFPSAEICAFEPNPYALSRFEKKSMFE